MNLIRKFKNIDGNKKKVFANIFWAMLGKTVNMIGALFVGILVARYLGPQQYGLMNYVISYVAIFLVLGTFGLTNIEVRELSKTPELRDVLLGTFFKIRLFFCTIAYLLICITLIIFKTDGFTTLMILVYGITLFTTGCFEVIRNYFSSIIKNEYVVKSEILRTIIGACIKIVLLYMRAPLSYFIAATVFDTVLVSSGYILSYTKTTGSLKLWGFDKKLVPYILKQSFPLVLSGAAVIIYQRIDQVMIGNMVDKEAVGYFSTAGKFLDLILFLPYVLVQTVTPILVKAKKTMTNSDYRRISYKFMSIVVWLAIILSLIVSLLSYPLIYYTYGEKYLAAVPVLQIMAWKTVGMAISSSGGQLIIIDGLQKWAVIRNLMGCFTCVLLNWLIIPYYGIIGSAFVTLITIAISGCFANAIIPPYWYMFRLEIKALLKGWKELVYFKSIIKL